MPYTMNMQHPDCPASKPVGVMGADGELMSCHMNAADAKRRMASMTAEEKDAKPEPIILDPTTTSTQIVRPPDAPAPRFTAPPVPPTTTPAPTIALAPGQQGDAVDKAVWDSSYVSNLPDSAFLFVESGDKDGEGKTTPRSKRHFPYKDSSGAIDLPHLRNAIARIPQSNAPGLTPEKKTALQNRARKMLENANKGMMGEDMSMGYYPLYGATSFSDLDNIEAAEEMTHEMHELTCQFQMMVGNIMADPGIIVKEPSLNRLMAEFNARLQQTMKPKEKPSVWERIIGAVTRKPAPPPVVEDEPVKELPAARPGFTLWKENGAWRWLAIYSNNYRDQDNPPEIISEKSHKAFLDLVDSGAVDYPELWHWHTPGTSWGKADWLDYADGFAVASGYIYPGHEKEAEAVSQLDDIRVSHGMPSRFIVRNKTDPTIIDFHVTTEISDLPGFAAANPLTEFAVLSGKEQDNMAFTPEKRQYLVQAGLSEDAIKELEGNLAQKAQAAASAGLERKDTTEAPPPVTPPAEVPVEQPEYATRQEVAAAVADALKPLVDAIALMAGEVKSLKESDEAKIAKAAAATPRASLQELIAANIVGNPAAVVDGRTALAKAGPKQTASEQSGYTASPLLNGLMQRAQGGA